LPRLVTAAYAAADVILTPEQLMTDASSLPAADVRMDLVGQACATLTPLIASRMRELASGQVLEVVSDDPTARSGLAAWARLTGNPIVAIVEEGPGRTRYYLRRK
jgi:tRNA 2-thiouridine synthesizing protein A